MTTHSSSTACLSAETVKTVTMELLAYCRNNNWAGNDPYDALNSELLKKLPFLDTRLPRLVLTQTLKRSPINFRKLLLIPPTQNPKGLALTLCALLRLSTHGLAPKEWVDETADAIAALRSPDSEYSCWGYSFPWQTRTLLVPRGAPNLVCTTFVANVLLDLFEDTSETRYLDMAVSAADYVLNELYWEDGESMAGFCYPTPSIRTMVYNANFLGAALLCRAFAHNNDEKYLEPALKAARYSASRQREDGAWCYGAHSTQQWIDNFHTGYNLCALQALNRYAGTSEFDAHIKRGLDFYLKNFVDHDGAAKYFHDRRYPVDSHSVAQTIITLVLLKDLVGEGFQEIVNSVLDWSLTHLRDRRGFFYYQMTPYYTNKISYMRWTQAWMLLALSMLYDEVA